MKLRGVMEERRGSDTEKDLGKWWLLPAIDKVIQSFLDGGGGVEGSEGCEAGDGGGAIGWPGAESEGQLRYKAK